MRIAEENLYITTVFCLRLLWDTIYEGWSKIASDKGLTVSEEQTLWVIWLFNTSTVTEVAGRLQRDKGTISKCIYSLEENGLIVREAGVDRRSYTFRLAQKGEEIRKSLEAVHGRNTSFGRAFAKLGKEEQRSVLALNLKLLQHLEGEVFVKDLVADLARIGSAGNLH